MYEEIIKNEEYKKRHGCYPKRISKEEAELPKKPSEKKLEFLKKWKKECFKILGK